MRHVSWLMWILRITTTTSSCPALRHTTHPTIPTHPFVGVGQVYLAGCLRPTNRYWLPSLSSRILANWWDPLVCEEETGGGSGRKWWVDTEASIENFTLFLFSILPLGKSSMRARLLSIEGVFFPLPLNIESSLSWHAGKHHSLAVSY